MELGSGLGFTGISLMSLCNIKGYIFSDCHPNVMKTLANNVLRNTDNFCAEFSDTKFSVGQCQNEFDKILLNHLPKLACNDCDPICDKCWTYLHQTSSIPVLKHTKAAFITLAQIDWENYDSDELLNLANEVDVVLAAG